LRNNEISKCDSKINKLDINASIVSHSTYIVDSKKFVEHSTFLFIYSNLYDYPGKIIYTWTYFIYNYI